MVAEKLRTAIEGAIFSDQNNEYNITASFGLASVYPATVDNFKTSDLIKQADMALYEAKKGVRNRVAIYSPKKKWFAL